MSSGIASFGGDPKKDGKEMAAFNEKHGTDADALAVEKMSNDTVRASLALWTAGATYADIAARFNFRTPAVAALAIERALADSVDDTADKTKLRKRLSLTLDRLMRAVMPKAVDAENPEQLPAVRTILTIVERYSKLNGLDAPIQHEINMPDNDKFNTFIELAARGAGMDVPVEADPFDPIYAEVVEDEDEAEG